MELIQIPKLNANTLNFELNSKLIIELRFNWNFLGCILMGLIIKNLFLNMTLEKKTFNKKTQKIPLLENRLNRF